MYLINKPKINISRKMQKLVKEITDNLDKLDNFNNLENLPQLKKIENNNFIEPDFVEDDDKSILEYKIKLIKNANSLYSTLGKFDAYNLRNLKFAHKKLMNGIIDSAGNFRKENINIYAGDGRLVHPAPPCNFVQQEMEDLFKFLNTENIHPLIASCVAHYELEFIHPFLDGNGRIGRFLQTAILYDWNEKFKYIPIENIVKENQEAYDNALADRRNGEGSDYFTEFMLEQINNKIKEMNMDFERYILKKPNNLSEKMAQDSYKHTKLSKPYTINK